MSFDGILRTAIERTTSGFEGARKVGSTLAYWSGANVQVLLQAIANYAGESTNQPWTFERCSYGYEGLNLFRWYDYIGLWPVGFAQSSDGWIGWQMPTSGVLDQTSTERASATGITLSDFESLWVYHTRGGTYNAGAVWRVTDIGDSTATQTYEQDPNWFRIAWVNSDLTPHALYLASGEVILHGTYRYEGRAAPAYPPGGTAGQVLAKNTATDNDVTWATVSGSGGATVDASATVKGVIKTSVAPAVATNPIAVESGDARVTDGQIATVASIRQLGIGATTAAAGNDSRIPTQTENDALVGTAGTPSSTNQYVTTTDTRMPTQTENDALPGTVGTPSSTNKYVTAVHLTTGLFSAYRNTAVSLAASTTTKVTFDTEEYDVSGWFASGTYTPLRAGYYMLWAGVGFNGLADQVLFQAYIHKNGVEHKLIQQMRASGTASARISGSCIVQANGTTDTFEVWARQESTVSQGIATGSAHTWFQGVYLGT